ncbi:MAG: MAPEG family protein [Stenotrophobium sp.]
MTGITALLLFAAWTLVIMLAYVGYRVALVLAGKKLANAWTRGTPSNDPGFVVRASHAHMNCVENLPVFGAIVLAAWALGKSPMVDHVAVYFIAARIAQTVVHLTGVSHPLVLVRATLFSVQVLLCFYMIGGLLA